MSTSSSSSSTPSSFNFLLSPCPPPFVVIRSDSPLLGFDNDGSDDPLHFPSPDYPRPLPFALEKVGLQPLPPSVRPGLQKRASTVFLRKFASPLVRSRANSSASKSLRSLAPSASESVRHAVYIDSDTEDSDGDLAHRLDALLSSSSPNNSASSSRINFPLYTPSERSEASPPSSPSSPICRFSFSRLPSESPASAAPLELPRFAPPHKEECSRWSLCSSDDIPVKPKLRPVSPRHPVEHDPVKSSKRQSIIRFAVKKPEQEFQPPLQQQHSPPPKESKRKRFTSLISRLSLVPRASIANGTLASIPSSPVSTSPSPPPSATLSTFSYVQSSPSTPATPCSPFCPSSNRLEFDQGLSFVDKLPRPHRKPLKRRPALRPSKSDYQLRRLIADSHQEQRLPQRQLNHENPLSHVSTERTSVDRSNNDKDARYPFPLTLPQTSYMPSSLSRRRSSAIHETDSLALHWTSAFVIPEYEEGLGTPTEDDLEEGEALLELVLGPRPNEERHQTVQPTGAPCAF